MNRRRFATAIAAAASLALATAAFSYSTYAKWGSTPVTFYVNPATTDISQTAAITSSHRKVQRSARSAMPCSLLDARTSFRISLLMPCTGTISFFFSFSPLKWPMTFFAVTSASSVGICVAVANCCVPVSGQFFA